MITVEHFANTITATQKLVVIALFNTYKERFCDERSITEYAKSHYFPNVIPSKTTMNSITIECLDGELTMSIDKCAKIKFSSETNYEISDEKSEYYFQQENVERDKKMIERFIRRTCNAITLSKKIDVKLLEKMSKTDIQYRFEEGYKPYPHVYCNASYYYGAGV